MHGRFNAFRVMLGAVCIGIIWTLTAKLQKNVLKPVGPKMCESLCKRIIGCSHYTYMIGDLSCHLTEVNMNREDPDKERCVIKSIKGTYQKNRDDRMKHCRRNTIIVRTRGKHSVCRQRGQKLKRIRQEKQTRLLMLPKCLVSHNCVHSFSPKQLFLNNRSVVPCSYLAHADFRAVAYISSSKQLAVSTDRRFYLFSLINAKVISDRDGIKISAITVDEYKETIFVATIPQEFRLHAMTIDGKNLTSVCNLIMYPHDIAADPKRSHIYVMYRRMIVKMSYSGMKLGTVAKGQIMKPFMFVDFGRDLLYYMTGTLSVVVQVSMANNSTVKTIKLELRTVILRFYVVGSDFYVVPRPFDGKLIVVSENGSKTAIQTDFKRGYVFNLSFCVIP